MICGTVSSGVVGCMRLLQNKAPLDSPVAELICQGTKDKHTIHLSRQ